MTGWRVGWAVVPPKIQPAMIALQQVNLFLFLFPTRAIILTHTVLF
jgi:aspartate/methionine/tyrosine aminotransferase